MESGRVDASREPFPTAPAASATPATSAATSERRPEPTATPPSATPPSHSGPAAPGARPCGHAHGHPEDGDTDDEDAFDDYDEKKFYFVFTFLAGLLALALGVCAHAGEGWAYYDRPDGGYFATPTPAAARAAGIFAPRVDIRLASGNMTAWASRRLRGPCHCTYTTYEEPCTAIRRFLIGGWVVSGAAAVCELAVVLLLSMVYASFGRRHAARMHAAACWLTAAAGLMLLFTFITFTTVYGRNYCGEDVARRGHASWSYGVRIGEGIFVGIVALVMLFELHFYGSRRLTKSHVFAVGTALIGTLLTTVGRGWIQDLGSGTEIGLWAHCLCERPHCDAEVETLDAIEACSVLSMIFLWLFLISFFMHLSKRLQLPLLGLSLASMTVVVVVFPVVFTTEFCGKPSLHALDFKLGWSFGFDCAAWSVIAVLVILVGYRHWTDPFREK